MSEHEKSSRLEELYREYLEHHDTANFLEQVSRKYTQTTLLRLAASGAVEARRGVMFALGFLGDYGANDTFGRLLCDPDHGVRLLAEYGIKNIWPRAGSEDQRRKLRDVMRLIASSEFAEAVRLGNILVEEAPDYAEARNQRGIAFFALKQYADAIADGMEALVINPYHFGAAIGIAHAYQLLNEPQRALAAYHRALKINPGLETAKLQIARLAKRFE